MITILGGEMLCSLGSKPRRLQALRAGLSCPSSVTVNVGGRELVYPYHRLDNRSRVSDCTIVAGYLEQVAGDLLSSNQFASTIDGSRVGLFLGSSAIDYSLAWPIEEAVDDSFVTRCKRQRVGGGNYLENLKQHFSFLGPALTYNTACTSSANALLGAASMLASKVIDYALVLGLELYSPTTLEGFALLQLLSETGARPFAQNRNGIVLGETVSVCLLSRDEVASSKWFLRGGKSACDTFSVTGADPGGAGIAKVMHGALSQSKTAPEEISLIKAHGTASDLNDRAEMRGMERVFAKMPPYLSLKPCIGHTLGGCGVAELLLLLECVDAGFIPAAINSIPLDDDFSQTPLTENMVFYEGRMMLNYFGFGGNNTSLIVEKVVS
ncbi:hypothetical protein KAI46_16360 [bacterium]|nr:hypothetical protein [bacterium]